MHPKARTDSLIVQEFDGETLIYDRKSDKAHCLNPTAAFVWKHSDGETSLAQLARMLESDLRIPASEEFVFLALDRLEKARLLSERLERPATSSGISRREVARKLGLVGGLAAAIPLVTSIVAPHAAEAGSVVTITPAACLAIGSPVCPGVTCSPGPGATKCKANPAGPSNCGCQP